MTSGTKRYHPAMMAVEFFDYMKGTVWLFILLFVINGTSTSIWAVIGRYLLLLITVVGIIYIFLKWCFHRYELKGDSIILYEGVFVKKQRTTTLDRIHDHTSSTTFIHKWFGLTSLKLETGTTGDESSYDFPVITQVEKDRIIERLHQKHEIAEEADTVDTDTRRIHFQSTKKDIIKASFTSFSFLAIFPILAAIYSNLADLFEIEETAENAFDYLFLHWWILLILLFIALLISVTIGYIQTTIKYGNFIISDDPERIYIEKGVGNVIRYSILKHRVQAVIVEQSILKRILGLASIKLISAGGTNEEEHETGSLYPYMPKKEAYQILQAMLPHYMIAEKMERFPIKVLWLRLIQPYYLSILALIGLFIFKKEWIWVVGIIVIISILIRILDYLFTSYIRNGTIVQIRRGGLTNATFVTDRKRIQQITVKQSWLQRKFNVATLVFTNKAKPLHESEIYGISTEEASTFYTWYKRRRKE